jgi:hypothetical protein
MHYRIFVADMGKFRDSRYYEFVAEFADQDLASYYCSYLRKKKRRFAKKDIIIKEIPDAVPCDAAEGTVGCVISVMGECLPVEEYEFT